MKDWDAFIFSLISNEHHAPVKMLANNDNDDEDGGVWISDITGPAFGRDHDHCGFMPDFEIAENTGSWSKAQHTRGYRYPYGLKKDTFLAGARRFDALELEVFWIDK